MAKNNSYKKPKRSRKVGIFAIIALCTVLSITLTAGVTVAWFAGSDSANNTLYLGGPVEVALTNANGDITSGENNLTTSIARAALLPGMAIDMQAIAKLTSTDPNPTPAILRAKITCTVQGDTAGVVNDALNAEIVRVLTMRTATDNGWYKNGDFYYYAIAGSTTAGDVVLVDNTTSPTGTSVTFINDKIILPGPSVTNASADAEVFFEVVFQAVQAFLPDATGYDQTHNITNADVVFGDAFPIV